MSGVEEVAGAAGGGAGGGAAGGAAAGAGAGAGAAGAGAALGTGAAGGLSAAEVASLAAAQSAALEAPIIGGNLGAAAAVQSAALGTPVIGGTAATSGIGGALGSVGTFLADQGKQGLAYAQAHPLQTLTGTAGAYKQLRDELKAPPLPPNPAMRPAPKIAAPTFGGGGQMASPMERLLMVRNGGG